MASHCGIPLARTLGKSEWEELRDTARDINFRCLGVPASDDPNFDAAAVAAWLFVRSVGGPDFTIPGDDMANMLIFTRDSTGYRVGGQHQANRLASKLGKEFPGLFECDWGGTTNESQRKRA